MTYAVIFGGLTGAIVWDLITWYYGLPTSSSHALIGGYAGAAVAKAGFGAISLRLDQDPDLHRPRAAHRHGLGFLLMATILWIFRGTSPSRVDHWFRRLQLLSAAAYSLGHGANDAQKTMGIIAGALVAGGYLDLDGFTILGRPVGPCCYRARHALRRLANHPHDGVEDHEAPAGGWIRCGDRGRVSLHRTLSACR